MGLFVTLAKPTAPMKKEAASAGVLDTPFGKISRLQIVTIEDLFAGKKAVSMQIGLNRARAFPSLRRCATPSAISTAHPR